MRTLLRLAGCTLMLAVPVVSSISGTSPLPLTPFRLGPATTYPADTSNGDVAIGDLNGDRRPDLVIASYFPDRIEVRLNQGLGVFGPAASYPVATSPADVELADVNRDGRLDVVVAPQGGVRITISQIQPGIAVLLSNADGTLQPQIFSPLAAPLQGYSTGPSTVAVGDMNGDGHLDAVVNRFAGFIPGPIDQTLFEFDVALGDGTGAFTVSSRTAGEASEVHLGDFDRDGALDVVAIGGDSARLFRGNGTGGLHAGTAIYTRAGASMEAGDIGDLNGDGFLDVIVTPDPGVNGVPETLVALRGKGDGTFHAPNVTTLTGERSLSSRIADMDGDGIADVVHDDDLNAGPRTLLVSLGLGDGTFKPVYPYQLPSWPDKLDVADVDGNGLPDVVVTVPNIGIAVVLDGSDRMAPVLTLPSTLTVEADRPSGAVVSYAASASDNLEGSIPAICSPASGAVFAIGDTTVSCSAADAFGNQAQGSFHIVVRDTTRPVLTVPGAITAEAAGPAGAIVTFAATATDVVDGSIAPLCAPAAGAIFPLGDTTVSCSATDRAGNQSDDVFLVTVRDTTAPQLTVPADITANATTGTTHPTHAPVTFTASARDFVDGLVIPVCTPASGSLFALGATTVVCTATDARGNTSAPKTFTVTVQSPPPYDPFAQLIAASTGVGPGKSLVNKALEARAAYQAFNSAGACSVLTGYLNEVRAQSGKKLTVAQAAMLTDLAQTVRAFLGC